MAPKNKKIENTSKAEISPEEVIAFFAKFGNYRLGSGPTIEELYQMFSARSMGVDLAPVKEIDL
jgi:hypothetical protein